MENLYLYGEIEKKIFMGQIKLKLKNNLDVVLLFLFSFLIFSFLIRYVKTDIQVHIQHAVKINSTTTSYPANFLFYFILNLLSGFSNSMFHIKLITIVLLSAATVSKYVISRNIFGNFKMKNENQPFSKKTYLIAFGLFFCFAIPDPFSILILKKMYLGKFVPIVWHNSTIIMLFPFAILLFWKQLKLFEPLHETTIKEILVVNGLVVINVIIKPSFIFVYLPVTLLFLIYRIRFETLKTFILKISPLITGGLIILLQYYIIYILQMGSFQKESSGVLISYPFEVLSKWVPIWYIPFSLFFSFTLPIFVIFLNSKIIKNIPFLYSLCLTIAGIIISAFIKESGPRMYHGNFMWQNIICSYLLFFSTILFLSPYFSSKNLKTNGKMAFLFGLFLLHAFSGILYIVKLGLTSSYL